MSELSVRCDSRFPKETGTRRNYFWPKGAQFCSFQKIRRSWPTDPRGKMRADDPLVTGGIIQVLKSGERFERNAAIQLCVREELDALNSELQRRD